MDAPLRIRPRLLLAALRAAAAAIVAVAVAAALGPGAPPAAVAAAAVVAFLAARGALALGRALSRRGGRRPGSPLGRLAERYAGSARELDRVGPLAEATADVLEVGLGCGRVALLVPDGGAWQRADGAAVPAERAPGGELAGWLQAAGRPVHVHDLGALPGERRRAARDLLASHGADLVVPLVARDELAGLILAGDLPKGRGLRDEERAFVADVAGRAASALAYARMKRKVIRRVEMAQDVELTAEVQAALIPEGGVQRRGGLRLAGAYSPATRCGGDWWSARELPGGSCLVLVGDVTGHGVAAAMVTAAAKGCCDVAHELMGATPDLGALLDALDATVRRVNAGRLHMTCFATRVDAVSGTVEFANAGHVVPYLCRRREGRRAELKALVARGNPLGSGDGPVYELGRRSVEPGDVLVWYTDGVVEAQDADAAVFGDRRMQRIVRRAVDSGAGVEAVRDRVIAAAAEFAGGRDQADDMTLVVAEVGGDGDGAVARRGPPT